MKSWIVVSYYTLNTFYEEYATKLVASLEQFKILYHVVGVRNLRDWHKNTNYKPTFLKKMLDEFPDKNVVWVDCDAVFKRYPKLFDTLDCDIAAHEFDCARYYKGGRGTELLSGTLFLRNNEEVRETVKAWEQECIKRPRVWDQKSLEKVLAGQYHKLPKEYCQISGTMRDVKNPVIVHYQASKRVRKKPGLLRGR